MTYGAFVCWPGGMTSVRKSKEHVTSHNRFHLSPPSYHSISVSDNRVRRLSELFGSLTSRQENEYSLKLRLVVIKEQKKLTQGTGEPEAIPKHTRSTSSILDGSTTSRLDQLKRGQCTACCISLFFF